MNSKNRKLQEKKNAEEDQLSDMVLSQRSNNKNPHGKLAITEPEMITETTEPKINFSVVMTDSLRRNLNDSTQERSNRHFEKD